MAFSLCIGAVVAAPGAGRGEVFSVFVVWAEAAPVIRASAATAIGSLRMEGSNAGEALLPTRPFRVRFRRRRSHITHCYCDVTKRYLGCWRIPDRSSSKYLAALISSHAQG